MKDLLTLAIFFILSTVVLANDNSLIEQLKAKCNDISGTSFDGLNGCTCSEGKVYTFDRISFEGRCEQKRVRSRESICSSPFLGCLLQADQLQGDLFPIAIGAALKFSVTDEKKDEVLAAVEQEEGTLTYWHPYTNYYLSGQIIVDIFQSQSLNSHNMNLIVDDLGLSDYPLAENRVTGRETDTAGNIKLYSPDLEGALYLMGLKSVDDQILSEAIPELPGDAVDNELQDIVYRAYSSFLQNKHIAFSLQNNTVVVRGNSCFDICRSSIQLANIQDENDSYNVYYHHEILRGMIHKRFINIKKEIKSPSAVLNDSIDVSIQLAPNLYPSYVLVRKYEENTSGEVIRRTKLYDRLGSAVLSDNVDVLVSEKIRKHLNDFKSNRLIYDEPKILLCEGVAGYSEDEINNVGENLRVGPKRSIFGWTSPDVQAGTAQGFVSTLFYKEFGTLGMGNDNTVHLASTVLAAKSVYDDIQVLPLGMPRCISTIEKWKPMADNNNARVVSVSRTFLQRAGTESCKQGLLKNVTVDGSNMLWVIAAGNDGRENTEGYNCLHKTVENNILTVAASTPDGTLEDYSNFGLSHADIATSGEINGAQGTSFSAPRIASLAARLSNDFAELTPKQIKLAILLGAEFKPALKSKLRSASYINFDKTNYSNFSESARCLQDADTQEKHDACLGITKEQCVWWRVNCHEDVNIPEKIAFFKEQGLL